jgi:hypothetical protein
MGIIIPLAHPRSNVKFAPPFAKHAKNHLKDALYVTKDTTLTQLLVINVQLVNVSLAG